MDAAFAHVKGASSQGNAATLGEWLVANGALSRYQVQTLLARRPGPFVFGEYCVYDRVRSKEGRLAGLFRAMHVATRHPVLLYFLPPEIGQNAEAWSAAANQLAWACWVGHPFVAECHQLADLGEFKIVVLENLVGETAAVRLAGAAVFRPPMLAGSRIRPCWAWPGCISLAWFMAKSVPRICGSLPKGT